MKASNPERDTLLGTPRPMELTTEQEAFRDAVRRFARQEIAPVAAANDELKRFPVNLVRQMGELGFLGIPVPEEYEGAGADLICYVLAQEEIAYYCASTALTLAAHTSLATLPILQFGTEAQREKYLPELASGRMLGGFGLTESHAGSDAAGIRTRAERSGAEYILNGSKCFITNGSRAGVIVVLARTDDAPGSQGLSAFIVESDFPGFSVGKIEDKLGMRASDTAEILFNDCRVPAANRLGAEGDGFRNFMATLDGGRIGIGAMGIGIGQAAYDIALEHARRREAFGVAIGQFGALQEKIADMATALRASRLLVYDAAHRRMAGMHHRREAAMAKLLASESSCRITREAIQILGGSGYSRELPLQRYFRDAKLLEIGEGTSEIQRRVIARLELLAGEGR